jgi:hypothetical protein
LIRKQYPKKKCTKVEKVISFPKTVAHDKLLCGRREVPGPLIMPEPRGVEVGVGSRCVSTV